MVFYYCWFCLFQYLAAVHIQNHIFKIIRGKQFQFQLLLDLIEVDQQWRLADLTVIDIKRAK